MWRLLKMEPRLFDKLVERIASSIELDIGAFTKSFHGATEKDVIKAIRYYLDQRDKRNAT